VLTSEATNCRLSVTISAKFAPKTKPQLSGNVSLGKNFQQSEYKENDKKKSALLHGETKHWGKN
jgi:hypothetical protein